MRDRRRSESVAPPVPVPPDRRPGRRGLIPMNADSGRLAALRRITNIKTAPFVPDDRYGAPTPDFNWLPLDFDKKTGDGLFLLRFEPGARSAPHEHSHG